MIVVRLPYATGIELHVADGIEHLVATGPNAFDGASVLVAQRYKPGVCLVMLLRGDAQLIVFAKDEFLPPGSAPDLHRICTR